jgi:hypothetical protein
MQTALTVFAIIFGGAWLLFCAFYAVVSILFVLSYIGKGAERLLEWVDRLLPLKRKKAAPLPKE